MSPPLNKNGLTTYQQAFVDEYMIDLNQSQAILRAGFTGKPTSAKTAATRMMSNVHVKVEVARRLAERADRTQITADRVLLELAAIAFFDVRKVFDEKNQLKKIVELDEQTARAISSIETEANNVGHTVFSTTKKIKMNDKLRALQLVGNHIGMFKGSTSNAEDVVNALKELAQNLPG